MSNAPTGSARRPREADPRRPRGPLGRRLGGRRHLPLRPARPPAPRSSPSTRRRRRCRARCTWARSSATSRPTPSPATGACGAGSCSTPWAGTTTACPPSAGSRTTSASRCDPSLPYDPDFTLPDEPGKDDIPVSRPNFIELCERLTAEDEQAFEELWRRIGLSVDWQRTYATIGDRARRTSQRMFLRNLARGEAYSSEAPTLWDVDFQTAVAQAEMEDREQPGAYHRLRASTTSRSRRPGPSWCRRASPWWPTPTTSATRPLFGTTVHTPLFGVEVPVLAHRAGRARQGLGHRHDLHLRRHHRRHLVARAQPADPLDHRAQRPHRRDAAARSARRRRLARHRRPDGQAGPAARWSSCWPPRGSWSATPAPSPTR